MPVFFLSSHGSCAFWGNNLQFTVHFSRMLIKSFYVFRSLWLILHSILILLQNKNWTKSIETAESIQSITLNARCGRICATFHFVWLRGEHFHRLLYELQSEIGDLSGWHLVWLLPCYHVICFMWHWIIHLFFPACSSFSRLIRADH